MTEWRPVLGFEGHYEVSSDGRVRSLARVILKSNGATQTIPERTLLAGCRDKNGYPTINLGRKRTRVHVVVLEAFVGPRPPGAHGCHRDDDKENNTVANLYWGSRSDNMIDLVRNGNHHHANKTTCPGGHIYDEQNTIRYRGRRYCRECKRGRSVRSGKPTDAGSLLRVHSGRG